MWSRKYSVFKAKFLALPCWKLISLHMNRKTMKSSANRVQFEPYEFQSYQQTLRLIFDYYHYYVGFFCFAFSCVRFRFIGQEKYIPQGKFKNMNHKILNLIELILNELLIIYDCKVETCGILCAYKWIITMTRERKLAEYFVFSRPLVIWDKKFPKQMVNLPIFCITDWDTID